MNRKSIGILGAGFVGGNLAQVFVERGVRVYSYDIAGKLPLGAEWPEGSLSKSLKDFVAACEKDPNFENVYFVCLPTPMKEDGSCDLSIVEGVLNQFANLPGEQIIVIKSTVTPGSCKSWNEKFGKFGVHVIHSPEFLREISALNDTRNQDRIILGGEEQYTSKVESVFKMAFPNVPVYKTSSSNSEMSKYVINCFLAAKVSFANEIYQICEKLTQLGIEANFSHLIELVKLDQRVGQSHWQVPSFEVDENGTPLKGFSGSCFPKDTNGLISLAKKINVKPTMLEASWEKNLEVRPSKDWNKLIGRAISEKK